MESLCHKSKTYPRTTAFQFSNRVAKSSERGTCSIGPQHTVPSTWKERLLFGTAQREITTFTQLLGNATSPIFLPSFTPAPLRYKHDIFHCKTLMPPFSQVCRHISRSTPASLIKTSWTQNNASSGCWSEKVLLVVPFFLNFRLFIIRHYAVLIDRYIWPTHNQ